jgi:uncharacterized protein
MDYRTGKIGRLVVIRFDDGDDFLQELINVAKKEDIRAAWFTMIGGLRRAEVVTGPIEPTMPPEPVWATVDGAREVVGIGSIFLDEKGEPKIHLHTSLGYPGQSMTACVRKGTKTYLILEVYLNEIIEIQVTRPWFPSGQFNQVTFSR